jgi:hypothetical protein
LPRTWEDEEAEVKVGWRVGLLSPSWRCVDSSEGDFVEGLYVLCVVGCVVEVKFWIGWSSEGCVFGCAGSCVVGTVAGCVLEGCALDCNKLCILSFINDDVFSRDGGEDTQAASAEDEETVEEREMPRRFFMAAAFFPTLSPSSSSPSSSCSFVSRDGGEDDPAASAASFSLLSEMLKSPLVAVSWRAMPEALPEALDVAFSTPFEVSVSALLVLVEASAKLLS